MLIEILITLLVVGAILYIAQALPLDPTIKRIMTVIAVVVVCIWLLRHVAIGL